MPAVTAERLAYLQRADRPPPLLAGQPLLVVPGPSRAQLVVAGIGRSDAARPRAADSRWRPPTAQLIAGLHTYAVPLAFQVRHRQGVTRITFGTWASEQDHGSRLERRREILAGLVTGLYPRVDLDEQAAARGGAEPGEPAIGRGYVIGVPTLIQPEPADLSVALDRLVRTAGEGPWELAVLARPVGEAQIMEFRGRVLNEARDIESQLRSESASAPLAELQLRHLTALLNMLTTAQGVGAWRTAVYLAASESSYLRLASAVRGLFNGGDSLPEPVRVIDDPAVSWLLRDWAMPDLAGPAPPGLLPRPYEYQTMLSSADLAAYVHLPQLETPGFTVRPAPLFAVSHALPATGRRAVSAGVIMSQDRPTGTGYTVDLDQLTRHAFIAGLTGSGKTNTVMHLLAQAAASGAPFLVIEPAKTEYRELLARPELADRLRVFTVGRESVAPLRLNPFEVPAGVDVNAHLDLLKAVFTASFAMWIPLPQVLEQCLAELYAERGWDFATGLNTRAAPGQPGAAPTLSDLVVTAERIVPTLGYKPETTQEITASLTTRLDALRRGARGLMLDVGRSMPITELIDHPAIIELEGLGDDDDKAFVIGLLLTRLYEHRRAEHARALAAAASSGQPSPAPGRLAHLLVIEEAHRLLGAHPAPADSWHADPRGAFVSAFNQMLSEVRAYGEGIIIADQIPVRLAPDVIKNTNLKIAHRLVAGDDREVMASAMMLDRELSMQLATLPPGRAAVFSEGDHIPAMVQVPRAKDQAGTAAVDDQRIIAAMSAQVSPGAWLLPRPFCGATCRTRSACARARHLAASADGRLLAGRLLQSAGEHAEGVDAVWPDMVSFVAARTPESGDLSLSASVHAFAAHALDQVIQRRANQGTWQPEATARLAEAARAVVAERVASAGPAGDTPSRGALLAQLRDLQQRGALNPYPLCDQICPDGRCPFRDALRDAFTHPRHASAWPEPEPASQAPSAPADRLLTSAVLAGEDVVEAGATIPAAAEALNAARWRAIGCAAQVRACADEHPRRGAALVIDALGKAGWALALP